MFCNCSIKYKYENLMKSDKKINKLVEKIEKSKI